MADLSMVINSDSDLFFSPMKSKNSLKDLTLFWSSNILFWNSSSSLLVSLQRLSSYSSSNNFLDFLFSQISVMNNL